MEYDGMSVELVFNGTKGPAVGNNGSTVVGATAGSAGAGAGAAGAFFDFFFLGFFLPIIPPKPPAKQQHTQSAKRPHCQSCK
jgi:hypothetical protein